MATKQQGKVIYFIKGRKPSKEQLAKADKMNGVVAFRNVNLFDPNDPIEFGVTHVAGFVPEKYRKVEGIEVISTKDPASSAGEGGEGGGKGTAPKNPAANKTDPTAVTDKAPTASPTAPTTESKK